MAKNRKKYDPERAQLRLIAWVLALTVTVVSLCLPRDNPRWILELVAALIFAVGTVWPQTFRWVKWPLRNRFMASPPSHLSVKR